uniref:hypothetical protein n=1 Tax=Acinetobacter sp. 85 TaxID=3098763 RepID=UPI003009A1A7
LEIFQFGDSRHLANYAEVYGNLLTANQGDIVAIKQMFSRLEIIYESELTNDERSNFISELKKHIPESLCDRFQNYFGSCIDISGSNKQESKKTSVVQTNAKENTGVKQDTFDSLFTPGIFGTSTSYSQVEAYFSSANKAIKRKNHKQAQQDILTALKALQLGQWPIWDALVPEMKRGQKLLKETTCSQEDLIKLFQPLIVNERYAQHWFIAENLISWLSPDASVDDQNKLLELSINHLQLMVGASEAEVADFGFLEESNQNDKILSFVKLIVHVIDHPTWLRSEKAAEMLLWLLRNKPEYIPLFGHLAFSNNPNNHAEVICGVLDHLSYSESKLWDFLSPSLDFATIIKDCKHIGRLSILKRILNQTAKNGNEYAIQLLDQLKSGINQVSVPLDHNILKYPKWAMGLKSEWSELEKLGVVNSSLIQQTTSILEALCSPLTLETVHEIESLLSEGYYANKEDPLRWRAKVSYALQTALQSTAPVNLHEKIVEIFRPYNPTRLDHLRIKDFKPHGKKWLISQPNAIFDRNVYLDYYESFWYEGDLREVRMTAYLGDIPQTPISSGRFTSTEIPTSNKALHIDICANVDPIHTYFGSFTPAIPTPHFMQISDIDPKSLKRAWWRSSRSDQEAAGAPESEGCYLSINEDEFLKLQNKMNIFWIVEIDSQPYGLISYQ